MAVEVVGLVAANKEADAVGGIIVAAFLRGSPVVIVSSTLRMIGLSSSLPLIQCNCWKEWSSKNVLLLIVKDEVTLHRLLFGTI